MVTIKDLNDIQIKETSNEDLKNDLSQDENKDEIIVIKCHESALCCLELNSNGKLLATASERGTLVRIYHTKTAEMIQELRRGHEYVVPRNEVFYNNIINFRKKKFFLRKRIFLQMNFFLEIKNFLEKIVFMAKIYEVIC